MYFTCSYLKYPVFFLRMFTHVQYPQDAHRTHRVIFHIVFSIFNTVNGNPLSASIIVAANISDLTFSSNLAQVMGDAG